MGFAIGLPLMVLMFYHIFKLIQLSITKQIDYQKINITNEKITDQQESSEKKLVSNSTNDNDTKLSEYFYFSSL